MNSVPSIQPIVVGYDNTDAAKSALTWAADHATLTGAELIVAYVSSSTAEWELAAVMINPDPIRHQVEELLNTTWTEPLRDRDTKYRTVTAVGRPAMELMRIARAESASLIVIGMTGRGTLAELITGSTQHLLQQHAARPVVAVPEVWLDDREDRTA